MSPSVACSVEGCERPSCKRGWCSMHHARWRSSGDPLKIRTTRGLATEDRLWARVNRLGPVPDFAPHLGPCWVWTGGLDNGYGRMRIGNSLFHTHRLSYELSVGPIPEGLHIDHLCRVPACCNPSHLEAVTPRENSRRGFSPWARKARQTHCKNGHPLSGDNLYRNSQGNRGCRTCRKEYHRLNYLRIKGLAQRS
jgi:hypothetical protein